MSDFSSESPLLRNVCGSLNRDYVVLLERTVIVRIESVVIFEFERPCTRQSISRVFENPFKDRQALLERTLYNHELNVLYNPGRVSIAYDLSEERMLKLTI